MKTLQTLTAAMLALTAHASLYLAPSVSLVESTNATFTYPHPRYGNLAGVVETNRGESYGLEGGIVRGHWTLYGTGAYQSLPIAKVTVGGQLKNWGDEIQGYSIGLGTRYTYGVAFVGAQAGWQDMLGGGFYKQVEAGVRKGAVSLSLAHRWSDGTEYEGIRMSATEQTLVTLTIGKRF